MNGAGDDQEPIDIIVFKDGWSKFAGHDGSTADDFVLGPEGFIPGSWLDQELRKRREEEK